jgi:hypothetical protein
MDGVTGRIVPNYSDLWKRNLLGWLAARDSLFFSFVVPEEKEQPHVEHAKHEQRHVNIFDAHYWRWSTTTGNNHSSRGYW